MTYALEYGIRLVDGFSGVAEKVAVGALSIGIAAVKAKETVSNAFSVMTGDFNKLGSLMGALPGPIGKIGGMVGDVLGQMLQKTTDAAEGFRKLSDRTGASVEFLSRFTEAADDVFVSSEAVSSSLSIFARKLGGVEDAMDGSGVSADKFLTKLREIGVDSTNVEDALFQVADKFAGMANGAAKSALAVQLFGRGGAELIPILNKGRDGIREMGDAAEALGLVITSETVAAVQEMKRNQDELNDTVEGFARRLAQGVIPELNKFTKALLLSGDSIEDFSGNKLFEAIDAQQKMTAKTKAASQALREYGEWNLTAGATTSFVTDKTYDAARAYQQMYGNLNHTSEGLLRMIQTEKDAADEAEQAKRWTEELAAKQASLAAATNDVNSAFMGSPKAMDAAEKAQTLFLLATGQLTTKQLEQRQAMEAVRAALDQNILKWPEATKLLIGLKDGTVSTEEAFTKAGKAADVYRKEVKDLRDEAEKLKPKAVDITVRTRWDDSSGGYDRWESAHDRTVTTTYVTNGSPGGGGDPTPAQVDAAITASAGGGGNNASSYTNTWTSPYGTGDDDVYGDMRARGGPVRRGKAYLVGERGPEWILPQAAGYVLPSGSDTPGVKNSSTFNVNNPSVVINSINGSAIAQEILRGNMNVARRARARASLTG